MQQTEIVLDFYVRNKKSKKMHEEVFSLFILRVIVYMPILQERGTRILVFFFTRCALMSSMRLGFDFLTF